MSHYTVKFTGTPAEKHKQALKATKEYLGAKRFKVLLQGIKDGGKSSLKAKLRLAYFYADFCGVRGRTVIHALVREACKHGL